MCKILLLSVNIIIMLIAEHTYKFPGCQNVLVLDDNMKNRQDICYAKDAGFVQFPGLPGQIETGCVASPAFKSRFCTKHADLSPLLTQLIKVCVAKTHGCFECNIFIPVCNVPM